MEQKSYPFDESEEKILEMVRMTVRQYASFDTPRIGREVLRKLRFHSFNTTRNVVVTAMHHGCRRILIFIGAVAPNGRKYERDLEVVL